VVCGLTLLGLDIYICCGYECGTLSPTVLSSTRLLKRNMSSTRHVTRYFGNSNLALGGFVQVLSSERDEQILRIASELCPHLLSKSGEEEEKKEVNPSFEVKPLTGGLSNELFIVTRKDASAPSVLVRIHPDEGDEDGVVNRDVENHLAAWLSEQGIAPAYYGRFENGRIEEFYENVTTLSSSTMAKYAPKIAVIMAKFHSLNAPTEVLPKPSTHEHTFYETMDDWLRKAFVLEKKLPNDNMELLTLLENEWKWLYSELQSTTFKDPVQTQALEFIRQTVMTHMDGQSLNFLKDEKDDIRVIDFEYAAWNPRAVDIANTFCEYCDMNNICADFEKEYPSDTQQNAYLIPYIRQAQPSLAEQIDKDEIWGAAFLATIRQEIGRFSLVSHLGWATWSVIKSKEDSGINFDYIKYAHHRIDGYQFAKKKFFDQYSKL
jgi:thiamine kinase-like enzyme